MKRREFITLLGGAVAWPLAARAQQPLMPVVGWLGSGSAEPLLIAALHRGLREAGFIDGRNVAFEYRWANGEYERLPAQVAELVERRVAVIVAGAPPAAHAAKAATSTIPVVFSLGTDPVKTGLVESLNRPGGNLTGITQFSTELEAKRLEILRESVPNANLIALLVNPNFLASKSLVDEVQDAARVLAQQILVLNASNEREVEIAFAMLVQQRANALLVGADPSRFNQRQQFVELAARTPCRQSIHGASSSRSAV